MDWLSFVMDWLSLVMDSLSLVVDLAVFGRGLYLGAPFQGPANPACSSGCSNGELLSSSIIISYYLV